MMRVIHLVMLLVLSFFVMGSASCRPDLTRSNSNNQSKNYLLGSHFSMAIFSENSLMFLDFDSESFTQSEKTLYISFLREAIESRTRYLVLSKQDFKYEMNLSRFSHFSNLFPIYYVYISKTQSSHDEKNLDVILSLWHYNTGTYLATLSLPDYFFDNYNLTIFSKIVGEIEFDSFLQDLIS